MFSFARDISPDILNSLQIHFCFYILLVVSLRFCEVGGGQKGSAGCATEVTFRTEGLVHPAATIGFFTGRAFIQ